MKDVGVNPARAGMILMALALSRVNPSKPRASGDDPTYGAKLMVMKK